MKVTIFGASQTLLLEMSLVWAVMAQLQWTQAMNPCWVLWTQPVLRHLVPFVSPISTPQWSYLNCKEYKE